MPSHAASNPAIQQMYINGHFCYAYKFGIVTNGLGIVRDICFYNKDFLKSHPEIVVEKKSDSPDEDKSLADSKALIPTFKDFFRKHPLINPKTFLGDAAFDSIEIYKYLLQDTSFEKAYIPLKNKLKIEGIDYTINEDGVPCCPHDTSLAMKREGSKSHLRCGLPTMKFVCPKMKWEWDSTYKIRVNVEKSINHFKDSFCVAGRKTQNENLPKILFSVLSYLKPGKTGCFHCLKQDYEIVSQLPNYFL